MLRLTLALAVAGLALAGGASAGGWATAGLSPLPPEDVSGGSTWKTTITVLQHGRTPLDGVSPTLTLRNPTTGEKQTFAATPTGEPGKYAVTVAFPESGSWEVSVWDGFTQYGNPQTTTFGSVDLGAGTTSSGGGFPLGWTLSGVAAALAAALALVLLRRRSRPDSVAAPLPG
ncbi:MAG TPA: FixH family protein [Gaiellaceae bacterium]|nr:FixH family protein [Gaiellaceae bacterium]